ncbi:MAG: hypothetical protein IKP81_07725 [Paludibacteraceae bacterium]|nr:hypothetical protein [Paludibacteraceae bacterium]
MRKIILALSACCVLMNAEAKTSGIQDVQPKGGFNLGIMIGVPPADESDLEWATEDPLMPNVSIDGNWTVASGMFNTKKFGRNGAIDLGFYEGFCNYLNHWNDEIGAMQFESLFRCAFHFEFVKGLDLYAGMMSGINLLVPYGEDKDGWGYDCGYHNPWEHDYHRHCPRHWVERDPEASFAMGPFIGVKYFFTKHFGLKAEFATDFASDAAAEASFGLAFKFGGKGGNTKSSAKKRK